MNLSGSSARRRARFGAGLAAAAVMTTGLTVVSQVAQAAPVAPFVSAAPAAPAAPTPVVSTDTRWKYLENDTFPSAGDADALNWTKGGFDDTAWKSGVGPFGGKVSDGAQSAAYSSSNVAKTQLEPS